MTNINLSSISFRPVINNSPNNYSTVSATGVYLSGIKFKIRIPNYLNEIGRFPNYETLLASQATAQASGIYVVIQFQNIVAIANAVANSPTLPFLGKSPNSASSTASVTTPVVKVGITGTISNATSSASSPTIQISITSVATATASVTTPSISGSTGSNLVLQLAFPEEPNAPLWAANLSGQSFDDIMLIETYSVITTDGIILEDSSGGFSLEDSTGYLIIESATGDGAVGEGAIGE